jgi:predicted enzyme related to lactoylglutathione lyase
MPKRDTAPVGAPCWVDLMTSDVDGSRDFYARLLGWESEDPNPDFGGYFNFTKDGIRVAGGMAAQPDMGPPNIWSVYLAVEDAAQTVDRARASGAEIYVEAQPVADLGTMAVIGDVGGALIGMWEPGLHRGFGIFGEPGAPSWFELWTRDYDATVAFYREVFGWDIEVAADQPDFRYTLMVEGDQGYAGVMDASAMLPDDAPAHWSVYFGADDTDAAVAKTLELGGSVVVPAQDTPYGRLAAATDATGSQFKLVGPNIEGAGDTAN